MSLKLVLVLTVVAGTWLAEGRPTHCERWKGDKEFRCAKDNYRSDAVTVRNRAASVVTFNIGMWMSRCGSPGQNYVNHAYSLTPGARADIQFSEVGPGTCNEMFFYDCKINNRGANCLDAINVSAN